MSKIEVNTVEPQCGTTLTLCASGDTVALGSGASQTGFGRTGTVDWNTTKITADPANAVSGTGYFCDTSGGAFTVTLPTSPSAGDIVAVSDYTRTWNSNNLTIGRNSKPIGGVASDANLTVDGQSATFVFVDDTEGWININETQTSQTGVPPYIAATGGCITTVCTNFKVHTFLAPGTFTVTCAGTPVGSTKVDYLVVAGGGGGANQHGGGGGAGGYRTSFPSPLCNAGTVTVTATGYPITVGGGGAKSPTAPSSGLTGVQGGSSIFDTFTSAGGGGAGAYPNAAGVAGGSGGGGGTDTGTGGAGNTPPTPVSQGNTGGNASTHFGYGGGGGGGGAAAVGGGGGTPGPAGPGGVGAQNNIDGNNYYWAGGAGGGTHSPGLTGGNGGLGGGGGGGAAQATAGAGGGSAINAGTAGTGPSSPFCLSVGGAGGTNSGGGGGASGAQLADAGNGGSGVVIIRYKFQ